eukprot:COSAG01_NODE_216_length_21695_cov_83.368772_10_plen_264_part_00
MSKIAIIQFPGSNCHMETARACAYYGIPADIVLWHTDLSALAAYDAYILPGGFSYQDRVRAGVVAAKLPVMSVIVQAAADNKPVLGICNGCQILAEAGLVPDTSEDRALQMALAANAFDQQDSGFICDWIYVEACRPKASIFTRYFEVGERMPIPINHGEGRFVFDEALSTSDLSGLASFRYTDQSGAVLTRPLNGATYAIAGLSNKKGNVFAMMPHPERSALLKQVPVSLRSEWASKRRQLGQAMNANGPSEKIFMALKEAL